MSPDPSANGDVTTAGDVTDSDGIAMGSAAHNQSVNVTVYPPLREVPPDLKDASNRELQLMFFAALERTNSAIQHTNERIYEFMQRYERAQQIDANERKDRQHDTDRHRMSQAGRMSRVELLLVALAVIVACVVLLLIYLAEKGS